MLRQCFCFFFLELRTAATLDDDDINDDGFDMCAYSAYQ